MLRTKNPYWKHLSVGIPKPTGGYSIVALECVLHALHHLVCSTVAGVLTGTHTFHVDKRHPLMFEHLLMDYGSLNAVSGSQMVQLSASGRRHGRWFVPPVDVPILSTRHRRHILGRCSGQKRKKTRILLFVSAAGGRNLVENLSTNRKEQNLPPDGKMLGGLFEKKRNCVSECSR